MIGLAVVNRYGLVPRLAASAASFAALRSLTEFVTRSGILTCQPRVCPAARRHNRKGEAFPYCSGEACLAPKPAAYYYASW